MVNLLCIDYVFTAAIAAFVVATFVNYVLSRGVAFRSKRSASDELVLLFMLSMLAFLFNLGAFTVLYAMIGLDSMIAKVIGTGVGLVLNYGFRQFIFFASVAVPYALQHAECSSGLHGQETVRLVQLRRPSRSGRNAQRAALRRRSICPSAICLPPGLGTYS
jgi:putative flippase GtrA